jgi:hypothetical protein
MVIPHNPIKGSELKKVACGFSYQPLLGAWEGGGHRMRMEVYGYDHAYLEVDGRATLNSYGTTGLSPADVRGGEPLDP